MNYQDNWKQKTLEALENDFWDNADGATTNLVKRCLELRTKPLNNFTAADLRVMIGQKIGLFYLIPLACAHLAENIFLEAEFYKGDLLEAVVTVDTPFWNANKEYWVALNELIKLRRLELQSHKIHSANFDNSIFAAVL